ncbi:PREDICTED: 60S ribosomal protein L7a-like [Amphimedon queenslandica]|uniref:60S ribosomal protein L7a n=1 Tax=Amphimedon queenslandica TaxID=400682 RepID=A0A1X7UR46_AMPQE|nr:PREDICTED: 60S ribosomal protein L7a-like [Amphimedon queenslandica]|eukprot:XP_003387052.1 PREDICTED: 60S ribosomal protein L7a-like [Amphimedon queenslandica]
MPPKAKTVKKVVRTTKSKKVAPAPYIAKEEKVKKKKSKNPLIEKRTRNYGIGGHIQPKRDLTRFVKWPRYVRIQRQRRILYQRLKVPPTINQFTYTLEKPTVTQLFKFFHKYRPESKAQKRERLRNLAKTKAKGGQLPAVKKIIAVKYGIHNITRLIEQKKAILVAIAHDVDPIELVVWLPALCRRMNVPYCIVKSKSRLGRIVHKKTATAVALAQIKPEDKSSFNNLVESIRNNYNDRFDEIRRRWGGGIVGSKAQAVRAKIEKAKAKELASKMGM